MLTSEGPRGGMDEARVDMTIRRDMRTRRRKSDDATGWTIRNRTALRVCTMVAFLQCFLVSDAMAMAPTLGQQLTALITKGVSNIRGIRNSKDRWIALQDLQKAVRKFEDTNDYSISVDLRVELSLFLFYLDALPPSEEVFRREDCDYYRARLHNAAQTTSRRQFDFYAESAAKVIDSFCK